MSASPVLHIKDSYFFDVPRDLYRRNFEGWQDLINSDLGWVVRSSGQFKEWQLEHAHEMLAEAGVAGLPSESELVAEFKHWNHEPGNHAKGALEFLESQAWFTEAYEGEKLEEFSEKLQEHATVEGFAEAAPAWSEELKDAYNMELSGKIIIPQPFGELENLSQARSGFCISKFMIIELVVALLIAVVFIWLANKVRHGDSPKGKLWNMLEAMLVFFRDEVARPAIGHGADKFVPLLWTIFFFVLGCNLMGMVPWAGAPTGSFAVTLALAAVTLLTGIITGSIKFGPVGFWLNQVPSMDLPIYIAVVVKPLLWVIEVAGLLIKHGVLAVRLLANMVAGHLVLLGVMGLAFSLEGAVSEYWGIAAPISVIGATLFSLLELFVAFLQAYIFTFLSALFIGAANHHH